MLSYGKPWVWRSRRHRFGGSRHELTADLASSERKGRWWQKVGRFGQFVWWIAALFMVGAACFAVASAAGLPPGLLAAFAASAPEVNLVFFVGFYLQRHGYEIIPVNPREDEILRAKSYPSLSEVPGAWRSWTSFAIPLPCRTSPGKRWPLAPAPSGCGSA